MVNVPYLLAVYCNYDEQYHPSTHHNHFSTSAPRNKPELWEWLTFMFHDVTLAASCNSGAHIVFTLWVCPIVCVCVCHHGNMWSSRQLAGTTTDHLVFNSSCLCDLQNSFWSHYCHNYTTVYVVKERYRCVADIWMKCLGVAMWSES